MSGELPHNVGAQFQAKYDGRCPECHEEVEVGDLMGYVNDVAVCDGCYNDAEQANWAAVRAAGEAMRASDQAADPEGYARRQAAVANWREAVRKKHAEDPAKEWVESPKGIGFVRAGQAEKVCPTCHLVQPCDCEHEPPLEEDALTVETVEPGIQALMAAGLLQGQEPGGSGVCPVEITDASGKVTEVEIPVPIDPAPVKAPRKRASRAKAKPEPVAPAVVPSTVSVEDAAADALARVRAGVEADKAEDARFMTEIQDAAVARLAQLEANAKDWDPATIAAEVYPPAPVVDPLQASLQSAVDAGLMSAHDAAALGWVAPTVGGSGTEFGTDPVVIQGAPAVAPIAVAGPRAVSAMDDFKANYENPKADIFIDALASAKSAPEEDAILGALDSLAPYEGMPGGVEEAKKAIMSVIEDAITNHPRSLQKTIGPSEIGTECDHCLAAKLAEWEQVREGGAWLPTVGTAVHTWLEEAAFRRVMLDAFGRPRYLMERKVAVGAIGGVEITGSTDLVDLVRGMTWDWKIVGATTLKSAKSGPSLRYKIQQMLYARGWRRLGINITHVGIAYLPRNEVSLRKAVLWTAPYDEQLAVDALARADAMLANLQAMATISVEARDQFITGLPRWRSWRENVGGIEKLVYGNNIMGTIECLDCSRYPDLEPDPAAQAKQLDGLM